MDPRWITEAKKYIGLHEGPGAADNPKVVAFYGKAGHPEVKHDAVPWCAAFVGGILHDASVQNTGTLWALDYAKWGIKLDKPIVGAVGTKKRTGGGHVFFIVGYDNTYVYALGGNQGDKVCIEPIHRTQVYSMRWPFKEPIPENPPTVVKVTTGTGGLSEA